MEILVVDDEQLALDNVLLAIKKLNLSVNAVGFKKASQALEYAYSHKIDIAFLDIEMRSVSGIELARDLKKLHPNINLIFTTGYSEYTADAMDMHASGYILKPITAEKIKLAVGAVIPDLDGEAPEPYVVRGPNLMTAHPVEATITHEEIAHCLDKSIAKIETSILHVLEMTPPELYSDIVENGIFLSGGGALLRGLDKRLTDKVNIQFHVAEDPLHAVARGTCMALKNTESYPFLMR